MSDPVVRLHYLQNLALVDKPKELVKNLVTYQEAWNRLDQHYGESDMIVDAVVKEIEQLKFSNGGESRIVIKLFDVLQSGWDDLYGVGAIQDLCNVMVHRTIESKLP